MPEIVRRASIGVTGHATMTLIRPLVIIMRLASRSRKTLLSGVKNAIQRAQRHIAFAQMEVRIGKVIGKKATRGSARMVEKTGVDEWT
jgi:hypothetical protein